MTISHSDNATRLTIADVASDDAGKYVCIAHNYIAASNTSATLQVIGNVLTFVIVRCVGGWMGVLTDG